MIKILKQYKILEKALFCSIVRLNSIVAYIQIKTLVITAKTGCQILSFSKKCCSVHDKCCFIASAKLVAGKSVSPKAVIAPEQLTRANKKISAINGDSPRSRELNNF